MESPVRRQGFGKIWRILTEPLDNSPKMGYNVCIPTRDQGERMAKIKVNISDLRDFEPLPEGVYTLMIESVEERIGQNSGQPYLNWTFVVTEPDEYAGRKLWDNTSLKPEARWRLGLLWQACGMDANGSEIDIDTDELIAATFKAYVGQEPSQKDPFKNVNNIKKFVLP